jgi:hypothetical protein
VGRNNGTDEVKEGVLPAQSVSHAWMFGSWKEESPEASMTPLADVT